MTKVLQITENGFVWHIDAHAIAHNRAEYYAAKDEDTTYQEEYDFTMSDDCEIHDWYGGNMNWEDVPDANKRLVKSPSEPLQPSYSADLEIIEV